MKQNEGQILFKYFSDEEFEMEQQKQKLDLPKIISLNQELLVFELVIENCPAFILNSQTSQLLEQLQSLVYLGINGCEIKSLLHIPLIDSLQRLTLDNNQIQDDQLKYLSYYSNRLLSLSLINNELNLIRNSSAIKYIISLTNLVQLSIVGNKFTNETKGPLPYEDIEYIKLREYLFDQLPNLKFLDCIQKEQTMNYNNDFRNQKEEDHYLARYISHSETQSNSNSRKDSVNLKQEFIEQVEEEKSDQIPKRQLRKRVKKCYKNQ